jgi:MFS family permease
MLFLAPMSARLAERFGTKLVVGTGLSFATLSLALMSTLPATNISYVTDVLPRLVLLAIGMGLVMAPATESIMGSLPRAKAGVGSAMNDTTRQVGGALGVAVVGSVMLSTYGSRVGEALTNSHIPVSPALFEQSRQDLATALAVATNKHVPAALQTKLVNQINTAFVDGMHHGVLFAAAATLIGAIVVFRYLPAHGTDADGIPEAESPEEIREEMLAASVPTNGASSNGADETPALVPEL